MTYVMGNARAIVQARVDAQEAGEHLQLRMIAGQIVNFLVEHAYERDVEMGDVVITVWFGDEMVDLTMPADVALEWERLS